jgi:hypothetical protein
VRHTFSDTVNKSEPLVDALECFLKPRHVLYSVLDFLVAAFDRVPALFERIHAFVKRLFGVFMHVNVLHTAQCSASLGHGSVVASNCCVRRAWMSARKCTRSKSAEVEVALRTY